ncbi:zinc finger protein ZPR1-like isoform X2 [Actinia tenebrosa]|uniref:Zinc finger protein ZPR1-like isoform X2 n=1 Tax=Actinia tenebrosa TaxID=6105 RepID=A0A6P8J261_ACTTE|nr:zinc finger protein ZPR1-like isoform X2 [Actinia tenebrosa]
MAETEVKKKESVFQELQADEDAGVITVESLCMNCHKNGTTRLLLVKIPFFKEIILSSFHCEHCGEKNSEIQSGSSIQDKGCKISLKITTKKDLDRQVVKQESASFSIPKLSFEVPPFTQKGEISTIEGLITRAVAGLEQDQPVRRHMDPESAKKIDAFLVELKKCLEVETPYIVILDDCTGNSFIENIYAPKPDPNMKTELYERTTEQDNSLGFYQNTSGEEEAEEKKESEEKEKNKAFDKDEVITIPTNCTSCNAPSETRMKLVSIPHFKEVIIMALTCDTCGFKSNEVKSGSGIEPKGRKLTLKITDPEDLSRDILKSETCTLSIPELEFEAGGPTLGGKFTTIEGLLSNVGDHLKSINPFGFGDGFSLSGGKLKGFLDNLQKIISGQWMGVHIILDDPAGNSFIQNLYAPDPDPELTIEEYERTTSQNDELGILHMNTENYAES